MTSKVTYKAGLQYHCIFCSRQAVSIASTPVDHRPKRSRDWTQIFVGCSPGRRSFPVSFFIPQNFANVSDWAAAFEFATQFREPGGYTTTALTFIQLYLPPR